MQRVCSWCGIQLSEPSTWDTAITHGICGSCARKLLTNINEPLPDFLDKLEAPVALVDSNGVVLTANSRAREMLGKEHSQIAGYPGGDVMECVNSYLMEGCGNTVHCNGCTIRNSVMATHLSGEPCVNVPAYLDTRTNEGTMRLWYSISTEKVADKVLLKIEPGASPEE